MPLVLAIFGVGMTLGNIVLPRLADRALMPTAGGLLVWSALALAAFPLVAGNVWLLSVDVFCIGIGGALGTVLQTRLMDVAGDAQNLAAALNHVAFNTANALGPWLAGLALAAGFGLRSTGIVGQVLALGGLAILGDRQGPAAAPDRSRPTDPDRSATAPIPTIAATLRNMVVGRVLPSGRTTRKTREGTSDAGGSIARRPLSTNNKR